MTRPARKSAAALPQQCDQFNACWPVGTPVMVRRDAGDLQETVTTARAELLSGHSAVIWLRDVRGCYLLDRVTPRERIDE